MEYSDDYKRGAEEARESLKQRLADAMYPGINRSDFYCSSEITTEDLLAQSERRRQLWQNAKDVQDILSSHICRFEWEPFNEAPMFTSCDDSGFASAGSK